ncbi:MAG: MBL fold metallo-hydrolase [Gemmatimonadales bacterium]
MSIRALLRCLTALPITLGCSSAVTARPGTPLIEQVAIAMGGRSRILGIRTLVLQGTGDNHNLGQNLTPYAPLPVYAVTKYMRAMDFENARWRLDQTREPRFPTANLLPQRQRNGFDVVGYDITSDTSMRRAGPRTTIDRAAELLYHPIGFMRAALAPGANIVEDLAEGPNPTLRLTRGDETYRLVVDGTTKLPLRIERTIYNSVLGDVVLANEFSSWGLVSGGLLPTHIVQRVNGRWPLSDMHLTGAKTNGVIPDLSIPPSVRTAALVFTPVNVTADSVAPGVWFLAGGSHHSVAIEMKDHILLVEAPQSDDRTLAVIRRARELRPGKPVRAVINTHHHFDHAGGFRAAVSEGLTVITHAGNKAFFDTVAVLPFTIVQDQLAKSPQPANIVGVQGKHVLTDGARTVELHEILGSTHSGSMLMAYLPAEKILIEADLYTPPAPNLVASTGYPFAANLLANIERLGLVVERIVPIHGRVVPLSDLRAAAALR